MTPCTVSLGQSLLLECLKIPCTLNFHTIILLFLVTARPWSVFIAVSNNNVKEEYLRQRLSFDITMKRSLVQKYNRRLGVHTPILKARGFLFREGIVLIQLTPSIISAYSTNTVPSAFTRSPNCQNVVFRAGCWNILWTHNYAGSARLETYRSWIIEVEPTCSAASAVYIVVLSV